MSQDVSVAKISCYTLCHYARQINGSYVSIRTIPYIWVEEGNNRREVPATEIITVEERTAAEHTRASDKPSGGICGESPSPGQGVRIPVGSNLLFP